MLEALCLLELAEMAIREGRMPYSMELLRRCESPMERCPYMRAALNRRWLIASAKAAGEKERPKLAAKIPGDDEAMLLRAQGAVESGEYDKAQRLLEAMEERSGGQWSYLRGEIHLIHQEYAKAAQCYHKAEQEIPRKTNEKLEICYREIGDYKMAYYYAKKEKNGN